MFHSVMYVDLYIVDTTGPSRIQRFTEVSVYVCVCVCVCLADDLSD